MKKYETLKSPIFLLLLGTIGLTKNSLRNNKIWMLHNEYSGKTHTTCQFATLLVRDYFGLK